MAYSDTLGAISNMRGLLIIGLILMSCSKQDNVSNGGQTSNSFSRNKIKFNTVDFDSLTFKELIYQNDKLLNIFMAKTGDKKRDDKFNSILQSDTFRLMAYNSCRFKITDDKKCNNYRHLYIAKERNDVGIDLEPYIALYLVIIDPDDRIIVTEKLEEKSKTLDMTTTTDLTNWNLKADSTLIITSSSNFCSDIIVEGKGMTCWTEKKQKQYRFNCAGLELIKKDSTRTESTK